MGKEIAYGFEYLGCEADAFLPSFFQKTKISILHSLVNFKIGTLSGKNRVVLQEIGKNCGKNVKVINSDEFKNGATFTHLLHGIAKAGAWIVFDGR